MAEVAMQQRLAAELNDNDYKEYEGESSVGRWSTIEHKVFVAGCEKHGKDWKAIADMVGTRTVVQTRTHAQKYFQKKNAKDNKLGGGEEEFWSQGEPGNVSAFSSSSVLSTDAEGGSVSTGSQNSNGNKGGNNGLNSPAKKRKTGANRQKAAKPLKSKAISFDTVDNNLTDNAIPFLEETFFLDDEELERGREEEEFTSACDLICTPAEICIPHESEAHCPLFQSFTKEMQSGVITPPLILSSLSPPSPATDNEASSLIMDRASKNPSSLSLGSESNSNSLMFTFANLNSGFAGGSRGEWGESRTTSKTSSEGGFLSSVETMSETSNESACNDNYRNNLCLTLPTEEEFFPPFPPHSVSPRLGGAGRGKQPFRNRTDTFDSSVTSSSAQSPASSMGSLSPRYRTSQSRSGTFGSSDGLCATSTDELSLLPMTLKLTLKAPGGSGTSPAPVAKKRGRPRKYPIPDVGEDAHPFPKSSSPSRLVICEPGPPLSMRPLVVCEPGPPLSLRPMGVAASPDMSDTALLFPSESLDNDTFFLGNEGFSLVQAD